MNKFSVTGMSCAACSAHVEKAVLEVPGVTSVAVSLLTNSMNVEGTAAHPFLAAFITRLKPIPREKSILSVVSAARSANIIFPNSVMTTLSSAFRFSGFSGTAKPLPGTPRFLNRSPPMHAEKLPH